MRGSIDQNGDFIMRHLSYHMAAIVIALSEGEREANNFTRVALSVLASNGLVDIVSGRAFLSSYGYAHLEIAKKVSLSHHEKERFLRGVDFK
jgi:hypothetical protein